MNVRDAIVSALFSSLILAALPLQAITAAPLTNSFTGFDSFNGHKSVVPSSIEAQNMLKDRWKIPLSPAQIYSELNSYEHQRALISFFNFKERMHFISTLSKKGYGTAVEHVYSSFPALILSYSSSKIDLHSIDFSKFKVKYTYPIGTKGFTIPQNVETSFGIEVSLSEIRKALEIDRLHQELNAWGYGVVIAVLDSGMNISQSPSLDSLLHYPNVSKVIASWKMTPFEDINDRSGHGTHIASILAGNGKYIIDGEVKETKEYGIAPDAQLVNIKVLDKTGYGKDEWLIAGLDKAIEMDVDIISASLTSITYERIGDPMEELVYTAAAKGIMVIASAGNYGPMGASVGGPAVWDYVISVGATKDMHELTTYSSRGPSPDLLPGVDILAPGRLIAGADASTGGISYVSGTSVSTPIVSGVLAIYRELFPNVSISRLESALLETADDLNLPVSAQGAGFIDPYEGYVFLKEHQNKELITVNPKRISPENLFYYTCVEGTTKQFNNLLISSADTFIQVNVTGDTEFIQISKNISVTQGWNHISWNITIPYYTPFRNINAEIIFYGENTTTTKITIHLQTRFYGGTILFDISHDNDTENRWFEGSSPYGSHQFLGRMLMDRGFNIRFHETGDLTLTNVNILVISDPELPFSNDEINTIYDFVASGGSLLFLINSMRLITVSNVSDDPILPSNYSYCEDLLSKFNITIGYSLNIPNVPYKATTSEQQSILSSKQFIFWGYPIKFTSNSVNPYGQELAYINAKINNKQYNLPVALSTQVNKGRVMVFGSGYPFTNLGLMPDVFEENPNVIGLSNYYKNIFALDNKNNELANETFDWLASTFRPLITSLTIPEKVLLREQFTLQVKIFQNNGAQYLRNSTISGVLLFENHSYIDITLKMNQETLAYEITMSLDRYGLYTIFIPLKFDGHTPTDGRIEIFCTAEMWDSLPLYKTIASSVTFGLVVLLILLPTIALRFKKVE